MPPAKTVPPLPALIPDEYIVNLMSATAVRYVVASDGVRIGYAETGQGLTLLHMPFVFGNSLYAQGGSGADLWLDGLEERFRLIRYEGRGIGCGSRNLKSFTQEDTLRDLQAIVDTVADEPFYLLSAFWYVNAALQFALERPDALRGLILWSPFSSPKSASVGYTYVAKNDWDLMLRTVATMNHFPEDEQAIQAEIAGLRAALYRDDYMEMRWGYEAMPPVQEILPHVHTPTLLVKTRHGKSTYETDAASMGALMPRARVVELEGSSVCPIDEQAAPTLRVIDNFVRDCESSAPVLRAVPRPNGHLTPRELDVARMIAAGATNSAIAEALVISPATVSRHVSNILDKLDAANRTEIATWAVQHGHTRNNSLSARQADARTSPQPQQQSASGPDVESQKPIATS